MSFKKIFILVIFIAAIFMAFGFQNSSEHKVLFEKAKFTMETKGDLKGAIKLFNEIIKKYPYEREYAAKSQLYIGLCYEKLGLKEAQKAFQKVVDNYPNQQQEVAIAREKLSKLVKLAEALDKVPHKPTFRKIRIPTKLTWDARLSPDGQKVILVSDKKFWIMPLSGKLGPDFPGTPVRLNTHDVEVEWCGHAWSGDGKWIAFNEVWRDEEDEEGNQSIYIVPAEGGKPKKVYENYRDARVINYRMSLSPHGKTLAFSSVEGSEQHIYAIFVDGGLPKQLVDAKAREPVFSPDGKMIAYVKDKNLGRGGGGLWVMPAHGGTPKLVANAGMASSPVWSPEGNMIAFLDYDNERSVRQIYIIPVGEDGEAAGEMITIDIPEGIREVRLLAGWTPDNKIGAIFRSRLEFALYTLPAKDGKAVHVAHGGYPGQPRWSPDGKRIFHINLADEGNDAREELAIAFVPAEGGKVTTVPIQSDAKIHIPAWGAGNRISPEGKMIVFSGKTPKDSGLHMHIWTLPIEGGKPKQITEAPAQMTDMFPCWSPDGKAIAFVRARVAKKYVQGFSETNIYIVKGNSEEPKPLTSESERVDFAPLAWSPDGKLLAYFSRDDATTRDGTLNVIPVHGGEPRVLGKVQNIHVNKELAWSPDSKRIAFNGPKDKVIKVISLKDGNIVDIETDLVDTDIYHLDWSPDGDRLAFGGWQGGVPEFWLMEDFLPKEKTKKKSR